MQQLPTGVIRLYSNPLQAFDAVQKFNCQASYPFLRPFIHYQFWSNLCQFELDHVYRKRNDLPYEALPRIVHQFVYQLRNSLDFIQKLMLSRSMIHDVLALELIDLIIYLCVYQMRFYPSHQPHLRYWPENRRRTRLVSIQESKNSNKLLHRSFV